MTRKMIALIIIIVAVVGIYGAYYAYATTVLIPEDLETFKSELNATSTSPISESDINGLENSASQIESGASLTIISQAERTKIANDFRNSMEPLKGEIQNYKQEFADNRNIATRYDIILKGNVANEIRTSYDEKYITLTDQMIATMDKTATDIEIGDNQAVTNDVRELSNQAKQFNNATAAIKPHLQNIVNQLGG